MSFDVPDDRRYLETHEWAHLDDGTARVGITAFAQDELGDIVFVEFPDVGEKYDHEESFAVIESIKAVSDIYAPLSGTVTAVNEELENAPELVNEDPYGDGWLIELDPAKPEEYEELLDADGYAASTD